MTNKVKALKEIFAKIDPNTELQVGDSPTGSGRIVYGPFPSFIFLVDGDAPIRALVHVNADAPNLIYMFNAFSSELDLVFDGPFAVDGDTGALILGADAYAKKEDNILMFAQDILMKRQAARKEELYVPEEKKIIIAQ